MSHDARRKRMYELLREKASRANEALALYRPMPKQALFHSSKASERIVRGGNQSGKSASCAMEFASAVTGIPITGKDGNLLPYNYRLESRSHTPLLAWAIGYGQDHIGDTIYRLLFTEQHGLSMIKDEHTQLWRAWDPTQEYDRAYEEKTIPMPPMIPPRLLKGGSEKNAFSWAMRSQNVFYKAELANGTIIRGMTSRGEAKQGDQIDVIWIDEDIEMPKHVNEWLARLSKRRGRLFWSAFPHDANPALLEMHERAEEQKDWPNPDVFEIVLSFSDNPYMPEDEKRKRLAAWKKAGVEKSRDLGLFQTDDVLMYPEFSKELHGTPKKNPEDDDEIDALLRESDGEIPDDWTRFMWIDPGHSQAAVLFLAIPPPEFGDYVVAYDELYPKHLVGINLAQAILPRVQGKPFEAFGIDWRAGRQSQLGTPMRVVEAYRQAFEKLGIESRRTGNGFLKGNDNIPHRIQKSREWLMMRSDGTVKFKIVTNRTPNFQKEMALYKKRVVKDESLDVPVDKNNHLMSCFQYAAAANHQYVKPVRTRGQWSPAYREFRKLKDQAERRNPIAGTVSFGPASGEINVI